MAIEGKPIIFVTPLSENLKKLKDTINSDAAYTIYEVDTATDYGQVAPAIGASLTISSDIKKLAKILSENKKSIKKFNCKVLLLHDVKLPLAVSQKLEKLGLNEVLYEPIVPKTLLYKVSLLAKSLKNPIVKDNSDVVLKSKTEVKTEVEVKVDKEIAPGKISDKKLTAAADQNIEFEALTQKADSRVPTSKNLSMKNDPKAINSKMELNLNYEEEIKEIEEEKKIEFEPPTATSEKKKKNTFLGIMEDSVEPEISASSMDETLSKPKLEKYLNITSEESDLLPSEKNIPDLLEDIPKFRERNQQLPTNEKAKKERLNKEIDLLDVGDKPAKKQTLEAAEEKLKKSREPSELSEKAEKTQQLKLEEKREKLKRLKQMAQELLTEEVEVEVAKPDLNFDEMPELGELDEIEKEKAAKALRNKRIKELEELTRQKNQASAPIEEPAQEKNKSASLDLLEDEDNEITGTKQTEKESKKRKKKEESFFEETRKSKKDTSLNLLDEEEKSNTEEKNKLEDDTHDRQRDHHLALADDDLAPEEEKSNQEKDGHERDRDFNLDLDDDTKKKKKNQEEAAVQAEGFKVKKPEQDNDWGYDNIGIEEEKIENLGEGETIDYSQFEEYQESSAMSPGAMKKKRKVFGEKAEEAGSGGYNEEEATAIIEEEIPAIKENEIHSEVLNEEIEAAQLQAIEEEIALKVEEILATKENGNEIQGEISDEEIKAARLQATEEVLSKKGKEYTPDVIEKIKKKQIEAQLEDLYGKKEFNNVIGKAKAFEKNTDQNKLDELNNSKAQTSIYDQANSKKLKKPVFTSEEILKEKTKTKQFNVAIEEKNKTAAFYKEDQTENVIRYTKKADIFIPLDNKIAIVTEDEITIENPYVHHDTKGLEYLAGVRSLHYWEIFSDQKILEFVSSKIMISRNALTTFYYRDPNSSVFEMVYSGHGECPEVEMYIDMAWKEFENINKTKWENTGLPTWKDPLFVQEKNYFIYPIYEQEAQLGFAIISFLGQIKTANEAKVLENILSASRCYFLLRYHQSLGIELTDKIIEESVQDNVISINIFAKVKSFFKGVFGFMKKAA